MVVRWIKTARTELNFGFDGAVHYNKLDVLTGPNGSGKTEILTALATLDLELSPQQLSRYGVQVIGVERDVPSVTVAQTFSPFARFPGPRIDTRSISRIYSRELDGFQRYVCIGLHKSYTGVGAGVSRRVLEESLFRLSESPDSTKLLLAVLYDLDFSGGFELGYSVNASFARLFSNLRDDIQPEVIESLLDSSIGLRRRGARIRREIDELGAAEFAGRLRDALSVVMSRKNGSRFSFRVRLDEIAREFYILQALAFLRRLDLLSLTSCQIFARKSDQGLDIANASSGQQQLLCTLFGLATSIRNGALVLVDEPELSLHPQWQTDFARYVFRILEYVRDCHLIIATHSPLIVQSLQTFGAGIVQLGGVENPSDALPATQSGIKSVEQTLVDVFNLPVAASSHVANEIFNAVVDGETGEAAARVAALARLKSLRDLYSVENADKDTLGLIVDAIKLIESPEEPAPYRPRIFRRRRG